MNFGESKLRMNAFFSIHDQLLSFNLDATQSYHKLKHGQKWCLCLIYFDEKSSYEIVLEKDGSVSIHHKNMHTLPTETFKIKHSLFHEIVSKIFIRDISHCYSFRHQGRSQDSN